MKRNGIGTVVVVFSLVALMPVGLHGQTAATATISGIVTDATGAVIPAAEVTLTDIATSVRRSQKTNAAGQYVFANVAPGLYRLTVSMSGFRQAVIRDIKIEVAKSHLVNVSLEVGALAETVEVMAGAGVALQTSDATVGDTIIGESLLRLPTANRSAAALLLLQPLVMPAGTGGSLTTGQVAGARSDSSTFFIDGGDATSDIEGTTAYNQAVRADPLPMISVPQESIEEFRVSTINPNATFSRSPGAQISFVTKRGTNKLHGSAYWYHQNDNLNANTWTRNRIGQLFPELKDNRFGFSLGGPIVKDYLWLYGHYEGRRFPRSADVFRVVPTDTLRQGILRFRDRDDNIVSHPLATSTLCGPGNNSACDPRGLGLSPAVQALWGLLPPGNDPTRGDGLNTIGFTDTAEVSRIEDFSVTRLDYRLSERWSFFGTFRYNRIEEPDDSQIDIAGLVSGKPGKAVAVAASPLQPRFFVWGVTGQLTPRLTNDFRWAWQRHWWEWVRVDPFPQVPGTTAGLQLAGEPGLVDEPINIDTQRARSRIWHGRDTHLSDNLTWVKGRHTLQFGGDYWFWNIIHQRNDKVVGSLTSLTYWLDADQGVAIPGASRPPTCSATVTSNCLEKEDLARWDSLYAAVLGLVDRSSILLTYDKDFNPKPFGNPLRVNMHVHAFAGFVQDTWRPTPALTLTYGLSYYVQFPPLERDGLATLMVDSNTLEPLRFDDYIRQRREAAQRGQLFNPQFGWRTQAKTGRQHLYDIDWDNIGPRLAVAWNPASTEGFWEKFFGDRKTVIRAGYSLTFDRLNGVNLVMASPITVGFGQTLTCTGPRFTTGACEGTSDPSNAFRIGVDGDTVPFPAIPPRPDPILPVDELISSQLDIGIKLGESHAFSFTWQRELPSNLLLEVGYAGRLGRNLQLRSDINSVPYFFLDPTSGQTLAQAFDAVAEELRRGIAASVVTPQPWFENLLGADATRTLAAKRKTDFVNGRITRVVIFGINRLFPFFALDRSDQVQRNRLIIDGGRSNYHAGFISLNKRFSQGLAFAFNYSLSKSLDQHSTGRNQQFSATNVSAFDFNLDYGPSLWDRRHTFNAHSFYELPIGRGRRFSAGNWFDEVVGGWYISGIFTASSGLPLCVSNLSGVWGGGTLSVASCAIPLVKPSFGNSVHRGVTGSGGVGTVGDVNLFADPEAVFGSFRRILLSQDARSGRGALRGLPRWNLDFSLGKKTKVTESVRAVFSFDFFNVFNHMEFADPSLSLTNKPAFGVLRFPFGTRETDRSHARAIQFALRIEF